MIKGKLYDRVRLKGKINGLLLDMVTLKYILDNQVKLLRG